MPKTFTNWRKAGYASIETPVSAIELILLLFLLEYYIRELGLNPLRATVVIAIAVVWDAITDPVIGYFSDRSRVSDFGKRMRFILPGALGLALSASFLFSPPDNLSQNVLTAWLLLGYMSLNTTMTLVSIPHIACVGDYSSNDIERNILLGWRMVFANIGLLLSVALPPLLASPDQDSGNKPLAVYILSIGLVLTAIICAWSVHKLPLKTLAQEEVESVPLRRILRDIFSNRYFLPLLGSFVVAGVARAINSGLALFYYKDALRLDETTQVSIILFVFVLAITLSIPLWVLAGKRFQKKHASLVGIVSIGLLSFLTYPHFPEASILGPLIMAVLGGLAVGSVLLIESLVINAIDFDYQSSHQRRDGAYFGIWKMSAKMARALGIAVIGPLLIWTGYDEGIVQQSDLTATRLGWLFGYGVGLLFLVSALIFTLLPVTIKIPRKIH